MSNSAGTDDTMPNKIAIFVTCLVNQMFPEVGIATKNLLNRHGYQVDFPMQQTCCGQPFFNSGFIPEAKQLARLTIEILESYEAVILPSGSCAGMLSKEYPHLFDDENSWQKRAVNLGAKVFELSDFLSTNTELEPRENHKITVTYHDSCHMLRMLGIKAQPRQLLQQVGCEMIEMEESDRCCGFGGLFSVRMRELSKSMTRFKLEKALQTSADFLVTSDPGCLMQMRANHQGNGIRVEHLAVVLEELSK